MHVSKTISGTLKTGWTRLRQILRQFVTNVLNTFKIEAMKLQASVSQAMIFESPAKVLRHSRVSHMNVVHRRLQPSEML